MWEEEKQAPWENVGQTWTNTTAASGFESEEVKLNKDELSFWNGFWKIDTTGNTNQDFDFKIDGLNGPSKFTLHNEPNKEAISITSQSI